MFLSKGKNVFKYYAAVSTNLNSIYSHKSLFLKTFKKYNILARSLVCSEPKQISVKTKQSTKMYSLLRQYKYTSLVRSTCTLNKLVGFSRGVQVAVVYDWTELSAAAPLTINTHVSGDASKLPQNAYLNILYNLSFPGNCL